MEKTINDPIVQEMLKLTSKSRVRMTVRGDVDTYRFADEPDDTEGFELYVENSDTHIYGLSCCCVLEVITVLISDYIYGIITDFEILNKEDGDSDDTGTKAE